MSKINAARWQWLDESHGIWNAICFHSSIMNRSGIFSTKISRPQKLCSNRSIMLSTSMLIVHCVSPRINDPKELHTLVLFSLRHLFGDFESYSCDMIVEFYDIEKDKASTDTGHPVETCSDNEGQYFAIRCCTESVPAIRASLTIVTPPPFLEHTLYQIDVIKVNCLPRSKQR
jgi:hypothetical protein